MVFALFMDALSYDAIFVARDLTKEDEACITLKRTQANTGPQPCYHRNGSLRPCGTSYVSKA